MMVHAKYDEVGPHRRALEAQSPTCADVVDLERTVTDRDPLSGASLSVRVVEPSPLVIGHRTRTQDGPHDALRHAPVVPSSDVVHLGAAGVGLGLALLGLAT
jgi:hypothetical protein